MACASVSITSSPIGTSNTNCTKDVKNNGTLRRCQSSKDLYDRDRLQRSHSDPQLRCSLNLTQAASAAPAESKLKNSNSSGIFPFEISSSVRSFLFDTDMDREVTVVEQPEEESGDGGEDQEMEELLEKRANWVERLLELRSRWMDRQQKEQHSDAYGDDGDDGGCEVDYNLEDEEEVSFDRETFSKLLVRVPLSDTKLFSKLAFLCNVAYVIPEIKEEDLRKYYDLHFVTSSLEKKAEAAMKVKQDHDSARMPNTSASIENSSDKTTDSDPIKRPIRSSAAYEIAASAASYIQSRAKGLLALANRSQPENCNTEQHCRGDDDPRDSPSRMYKSEVAAYVAASTMTAVVAAEEAAKQQAAKDLQSLHSSPCEWFVVDDPSTCTRCFVTQGSDSLASWQANLFFEPTKFEGTEVFVHRGIYEAAKGIYEQFMPEIQNHLKNYGEQAKLRFIGHSLGGSLSLLVHLMLLARGAVKASALLPVVTFGSPFTFCGGRHVLDELGWDESNILSVMMHRDIVPRAFSCNYPNHVAQILKRLNGSFRSHPCLNSKKMLYTPLGQLFILQPDEKSSPPHPLLPPGSALYALDMNQQSVCCGGVSNALRAFLNSPHPLETLSDPTAYGSEGTILRDHDSSNYLKATNAVLRQSTKIVVRRSKRERLFDLWPVLTTSQLTQRLPPPWSLHKKLEGHEMIGKEVVSGA